MLRFCLLLLLTTTMGAADAPVYYLLWFDTEDYIEPSADDAALRIATELENLGVRATFKVVGEKARVLASRGRRDVIRALSRHDIGYHADNHSIPPSPAVYLQPLGLLEGAQEFERREGPGVRDIRRMFGVTPSCYGQPGSSWGPQSNIALRRMGIPVYMDEGSLVGYQNQPFWYMGILYVFNLQRYSIRADINDPSQLDAAKRRFTEAVAELKRGSGGVIHTYYHPTEFVATEFWDAVNFSRGAYTAPSDYKRPNLRTSQSAEQAYRILVEFVKHIQATPGVRIITARQLPQIYDHPTTTVDVTAIRGDLAQSIDIRGGHSPADQLLALLSFQGRYVDGPAARVTSTVRATSIPRPLFDRGKHDAIGYIERHHRLPSHVWFGSERLSLGDFTATLAGDNGGPAVAVRRGNLAFERHVASGAKSAFNWAIHPENFDGADLLELGRLQAWTLKPARLR
ncbi:MAG TPA: hypothetical protein VM120_25540 [Bryobacteraceae bacterium]|nr:hypothetical protein [Bryobacteraceae bacterium]